MTTSRRGKKIALLLAVILVVGATIIGFTSGPQIVAYVRFHLAFESLGLNPQGRPEYRHRQTGIIFVLVPGGTFLMGSPEDEEGRRPDERQHGVTLSSFLIAKYEVTQAQWRNVMGDRWGAGYLKSSPYEGDDLPMRRLDWDACHAFCEKYGWKPPTETQWEYACRAGTNGPFAGMGRLQDMGWYQANSSGHPHPVGQKHPNAWGLYDMHGNVQEWCSDLYDEYPDDGAQNPEGPMVWDPRTVGPHIARGGCCFSNAEDCRSACRFSVGSALLVRGGSTRGGFRPVASPPP